MSTQFLFTSRGDMSSRIITQIYEVQTVKEAEAMVGLGVDHIGSVVISEKDWKQTSVWETLRFIAGTSAASSLILLYHEPNTVFRSLDYYRPDIVHFCEVLGDPRGERGLADYCRPYVRLQEEIKKRFPEIRIMRSLPVPSSGASIHSSVMEMAQLFEPVSDFFLTDTLLMDGKGKESQPVNGFVGITGRVCDWRIAAALVDSSGIPVILAGGLSPDNVYEGIIKVRPAGVDSCTLTNRVNERGLTIRFQKDLDRVRGFGAEARRAEAVILSKQDNQPNQERYANV